MDDPIFPNRINNCESMRGTMGQIRGATGEAGARRAFHFVAGSGARLILGRGTSDR